MKYKPQFKVLKGVVFEIKLLDECVNMDVYYDVVDIVENPSINWFWFGLMVQMANDVRLRK